MSTDQTFTPPRKKRNVLWWLAWLFLLLALLFLFQLFGPSPRIVVSRETTYITEPLKPDGLPDYERYVLELYRQGVTPENNAAVPVLRALWPGELQPSQFAAVLTEMGLDTIPSEEDSLTRRHDVGHIADWLQQQARAPATSTAPPVEEPDASLLATHGQEFLYWSELEEAADQVLDQSMSQPWTSDEIPPLAAWIRENQAPLELIVEASHRPRCYLPLPSLLDNQNEMLVAMLLPGQQSMREAARALSTRAMWHLGENRVDEAWRDIMALHRLARLMTQGHTFVDQLIAIAISGIAGDRTATLLDHADLSVEQAQRVQRDLAALPDFDAMADCLDCMERASFLDAVTSFSRPGALEGDLGFGEAASYLGYVRVDWNLVLRRGNHFYDRLVAAARLPTPADRERAFQQIETELLNLSANLATPGTLFAAALSPSARADSITSILLGLFLPALDSVMSAQDRANAKLQLARIAAAIAVYRAERGSYPESLDDLVSAVLEAVPVDLYNARPLVYKRTDDGYLLYTIGPNDADEAGSHETMSLFEGQPLEEFDPDTQVKLQSKIPSGADDLSIRLPRPKFELPRITPAEEP